MLSTLRTLSSSLAQATGVSTSAQVALALGLLFILGSLRSSQAPAPPLLLPPHAKRALVLPSTLPLLGNTVDLVKNGLRFHDWVFEQCVVAQGRPWVMTALGRPDVIVVSTPQAYEDVAKTQFDNFIKGEYVFDVLQDVFGAGIFTLDGAAWARHRKLASGLFTMRQLRESMASTIAKHSQSLCRVLQSASEAQEAIDLNKVLTQFTTEAFCELAFGLEMDYLTSNREHPLQQALDGATRAVTFRLFAPVWLWKLQRALGLGLEGQLRKHLNTLDGIVLELITHSIEHHAQCDSTTGNTRTDLISLFLSQAAKDKAAGDGTEELDDMLTPESLKNMAMQFLLAGRETTAQTLGWFFLLLSQHPEVEAKLRKELSQQPTTSNGSDEIPMAGLHQCVYLEAALKETVRLYPSAPITARDAAEDTTLSDGTFIPKGVRVGLPGYAMARLPSIWGPDAAQFSPERWIDAATGKLVKVSTYKFVSFHAGPRTCIGMNLAMLEMKIAIAYILRSFKVEVVPGQKISYDMSITLPMKGPLMVRLSKA